MLREARTSSEDLEVSGDLAGVAQGATRYVTREDLARLPQVTYTATDDANFASETQVTGVSLEELLHRLATPRESEMVIAISSDQYRGHYPVEYLKTHRPLLVLSVNGKPPAQWPKEGGGQSMGPFLISHPQFKPSFRILSHTDEEQIPWGVVRIEFRDENAVFGAIAPHGPHAQDSLVQDGYRIAQQNCFRCHNAGSEGGTKANHPWLVLSAWAVAEPQYFTAYVRDPASKNPHANMPGNPGYDDQTIGALISYFRTFSRSDD